MKNVLSLGVAALLGLLAFVGLAPAAQAYPETSCNVTVDAQTVESGGKVQVHGTVDSSTTGVHWVATFNGATHTADSDVLNTSFDIPAVDVTTKYSLHVTAVLADQSTCERSLTITAEPTGVVAPPTDSNLPNTGGPDLWMLIAGLVLVGAGTAVTLRSRRRVHAA